VFLPQIGKQPRAWACLVGKAGQLPERFFVRTQVLSPVSAPGAGGSGAGFMKAPVLAEVSLAQGGAAFSGSPRAVALAAGTLDPAPKELVRSLTKQVPHSGNEP